jgi:hypothetical protein
VNLTGKARLEVVGESPPTWARRKPALAECNGIARCALRSFWLVFGERGGGFGAQTGTVRRP